MRNVYTEIESLKTEEYEFANQMYPMFSTPHEGYAVLLEEFEEAEEALKRAREDLDHIWDEIKADNTDHAKTATIYMESHVTHLIAECIQVGAMCQKFRASFEDK